jgi:hypothetical protein
LRRNPSRLQFAGRRAAARRATVRDFEATDTDKGGLLTVEEIDIYMSRSK